MNRSEFILSIQQEIRENGFVSASRLISLIVARALELNVEYEDNIHLFTHNVLIEIPCDDIKIVKYSNWLAEDHYQKDLYYFSPQK